MLHRGPRFRTGQNRNSAELLKECRDQHALLTCHVAEVIGRLEEAEASANDLANGAPKFLRFMTFRLFRTIARQRRSVMQLRAKLAALEQQILYLEETPRAERPERQDRIRVIRAPVEALIFALLMWMAVVLYLVAWRAR